MKELVIEDIEKLISENIDKNKTLLELKANHKALENQYVGLKKGLYTDMYEMQVGNVKLQTKVLGDNVKALEAQIKLATSNMSTLYKTYYNNIKTSELEIKTK